MTSARSFPSAAAAAAVAAAFAMAMGPAPRALAQDPEPAVTVFADTGHRAVFRACHESETGDRPPLAAAWLHRPLVFVHPFADGNDRVARLAMNTAAIQNRYLPMMIHPLLRREYTET